MYEISNLSFMPQRPADAPVSCAVCGCRLLPASEAADGAWRHIPSLDPRRDARGDRPGCIDELHDNWGHVLD